jgi:hypothetical protein
MPAYNLAMCRSQPEATIAGNQAGSTDQRSAWGGPLSC